MENVKIQFKGITRNTDDGMCQDGECMELINAHLENGSIEPIGKPILLKGLQRAYKKIYYHTNAKRYIGMDTEGRLYEISEDLSTEEILAGDLIAIDVAFVGNTIAVSTNKGMRYVLFKQNEYKYLGALPEIPAYQIGKNIEIASVTNLDAMNSLANFYVVLDKIYRLGGVPYAIATRLAFRLYDGSMAKPSRIDLTYLKTTDSKSTQRLDGQSITLNGSPYPYWNEQNNMFHKYTSSSGDAFYLMYFKPYVVFTGNIDLSDWSDIILGIDVYTSANLRHRIDLPAQGAQVASPDRLDEYNIGAANTRLENMSIMYRALQINDVSQLFIKSFTIDFNGNSSPDNIALLPSMEEETNTLDTDYYSTLYTYNNKIHATGRTRTLFNGYKFEAEPNAPSGDITTRTVVATNQGEKVVGKTYNSLNLKKLPAFIMYPSVSAKSITIQAEGSSLIHKYSLKSSDFFNFAYFLNKESDGFKDIDLLSEEDLTTGLPDLDNSPISTNNTLYVSTLSNPFIFPADQTYQFNTPIVGVQSNVIAMSQGQFGQFPLYVFTKDGIYALSVGSGNVSYNTQTPVTRDVCTNPNSICALDTAVAFATDKGLMVISGTQTQLISETIYGYLPSCSISSPIIPKILAVAGMENMISSVVFPDYLKDANVGYNYQEQRIIVANKDYPYSYVYSMKTCAWFKIDRQIDFFVNSYPYTWAYSEQNIYDLNNNHRSISTIALISRPIKMGTMTHKRILQTALRGIVKRSLSDLYYKGEPVMFRGESLEIFSNVGMYILGSNDCEHFTLVAKKEMMIDIRDLVTKMNKSKPYKYFMVCLVGGVRTDVSINYIEMNVDESFTNRLR